jgi:uncharacterized 2Fe-2S/4Fe-4S cluster protein (DUF4445 family)
MDRLGVDRVDEIRLAGAFGNHIDPTYAMVLGLIPDCDLAHVHSAGNAAGTGATMALLSRAVRGEVEHLVKTVEKVETAMEPAFQSHFVEAMAIPHASEAYPSLAAAVDLPAPVHAGDVTTARRRTSRRRPARRGAEDHD